jgi:hypothetical protein
MDKGTIGQCRLGEKNIQKEKRKKRKIKNLKEKRKKKERTLKLPW